MLVERFDANSYRVLLHAMDTHDLARRRGEVAEVLRRIRQPVLVGSIDTDTLYVPSDQHELARLLPDATLLAIDSPHGHDGFLIDAARFQADLLAFKQQSADASAPHPVDSVPSERLHARGVCPEAGLCSGV